MKAHISKINKHAAKVVCTLVRMGWYNSRIRINDTKEYAVITDLPTKSKWFKIHVWPDGFLQYYEPGDVSYESKARSIRTIKSDIFLK